MKKLILLALTAVMMAGCGEKKQETTHITRLYGCDFRVIEIDSCEYIFGGYRLSHKGNCRFCKKRRDKEMEELVKRIKEK